MNFGSSVLPETLTKAKRSNANKIKQSTPSFAVEGKNTVNKKML